MDIKNEQAHLENLLDAVIEEFGRIPNNSQSYEVQKYIGVLTQCVNEIYLGIEVNKDLSDESISDFRKLAKERADYKRSELYSWLGLAGISR